MHRLPNNNLYLATRPKTALGKALFISFVGIVGIFGNSETWASCRSNMLDGQDCCDNTAPKCASGRAGVIIGQCSFNQTKYQCQAAASPPSLPPLGPSAPAASAPGLSPSVGSNPASANLVSPPSLLPPPPSAPGISAAAPPGSPVGVSNAAGSAPGAAINPVNGSSPPAQSLPLGSGSNPASGASGSTPSSGSGSFTAGPGSTRSADDLKGSSSGGGTKTISSAASFESQRLQRDENFDHRNFKKSDQCGTSAGIDDGFACDSTYSIVQGAQVSNMLSQTAGSMATTALGQKAQMSAVQTGTQSSVLNASADLQDTTGKMQLGMGAANVAVGAIQLYKYYQHNKAAKEIVSGATGGTDFKKATMDNARDTQAKEGKAGWVSSTSANGIGNKIIENYRLNEGAKFTAVTEVAALKARDAQGLEHKRDIASKMTRIGGEAGSEQKMAAQAALSGGMMSLISGSQQMMSGGFSVLAAKQLKAAAAQMDQAQATGTQILAAPGLPDNLTGTPQSFQAPGTVSGAGIDPNQTTAAADAQPSSIPVPDLGTAFDPRALPSAVPGGPLAGKYNEGTGAPSSGGGGAGSVGMGGNTSAASSSQEDPQAKLAPNTLAGGYESGGSYMGGGGGGGKGAEGGPDLSSLLKDMLAKKDEDTKPPTSIMEYGGKLGTTEPAYPYLDPRTNIFTRVTDTYKDKQSRGHIGIN